jgi:hypothetical protein
MELCLSLSGILSTMHSKAIYAESHPSGRGLSFLFTLVCRTVIADTPTLKIAEKLYPQAILDEEGSTKPDDEPFRKYVCAKTLQAGNGGEPTLIVAAPTQAIGTSLSSGS